MVAAEKKRKIEENSTLKYLLDHFCETSIFHQQYKKPNNQLTGLFYASEEGIIIRKRFKNIFCLMLPTRLLL
jgi:hypothetical protein